eukprot:153336-Alexandrium_andersonii.AAC.1
MSKGPHRKDPQARSALGLGGHPGGGGTLPQGWRVPRPETLRPRTGPSRGQRLPPPAPCQAPPVQHRSAG